VTLSQRPHPRRNQVLLLVFAGILAKIMVFPDVAVNGDSGLYLYDAMQILRGEQILVDFPSRSPLMEYILAVVVKIGHSPIISARTFMVGVGILLGFAVYALARQLHSHRAGLVAAAIIYLTPFSLVWGLWVKTEPVASLLLVAGLLVALRYVDADRIPLRVAAGLGALFGVTFLIRRVVIIHIGAFALFVLWYRRRQDHTLSSTFQAAGVVIAATVATLAAAYMLLARGNLGLAWEIADTHAIALFSSGGQGSLGWVGLGDAAPVTAQTNIGALSMICQKCGENTVKVFTTTLMVTLPVVLMLLTALRSWLAQSQTWLSETALPTIVVALGAFAVYTLLQVGMAARAVGVVVLVAGTLLAWTTETPSFREWWDPRYTLLLAILGGLTAGYLYRDRILYVTYFQDFYPFVAVLAAIAAVEWVDANRDALRRWSLPAAVTVLLVASGGVAAAHATPYQPEGVESDSHWFSLDSVGVYGDDIDERVGTNQTVITAQPLYVVDSDHRIAGDLSRKYYAFDGWPGDPKTEATARELAQDLRSGDVPYAIVDPEAERVLGNDRVRDALQANYCRADAPLYNETGGTLYRYQNDTSNCTTYVHTQTDS